MIFFKNINGKCYSICLMNIFFLIPILKIIELKKALYYFSKINAGCWGMEKRGRAGDPRLSRCLMAQ